MIEIAPYANPMTYDEAVMYCFFLDYNGHKDWRMPTRTEYADYLSPYPVPVWVTQDALDRKLREQYYIAPVRTVC